MKEIEEMIKNVYEETFCILSKIYKHQNENRIDDCKLNSRLIMPLYRNKDKNNLRLSEQELRFVFVERFNKYIVKKKLDYYYSIETPTEFSYTFKDKECPKKDEGGRSASIDLVIFNSCGKRVALIEFKALNPAKYDYQKDFCKLTEEENGRDDVARYFIQILETFNKGTRKSIRKKLFENETYFDKDKINYICYNLNKRDKNNGKRVEQDILNSENND